MRKSGGELAPVYLAQKNELGLSQAHNLTVRPIGREIPNPWIRDFGRLKKHSHGSAATPFFLVQEL